MKKIILTLFFLNQLLCVLAQHQKWEVYIGVPYRNTSPRSLIETYDKGLCLQAWHSTTYQNGESWNVKTNKNGNILYSKNIIHNNGTVGNQLMATDRLGNLYCGGLLFGPVNMPIIIKYNVCNEKQWCVTLPDERYLQGWITGIVVNSNNEIIVSLQYSTAQKIDRVFMAAISMDGEVLWKKNYASFTNHPLLVEPVIFGMSYFNNEYYLSGYCYWPYPGNPNHVYLRPFFIGIDSLFNEKWILPFFALGSVYGDAFVTIPINDTLLMGVGYNRVGSTKGLLMFYTTNGNDVGYSQINNDLLLPNTVSTQFRQVERINDTIFVLSGLYRLQNNETIRNIDFVADTSGKLYGFMPRPNTSGSPSLIKTSDNNFVVATTRKVGSAPSDIYLYKFDQHLQSIPFDPIPRVYDSLCPYPIQSGSVNLSNCMVWVGTENIPTPREYYARISAIPITTYPNPATDKVTFAFENTEHHRNISLQCYTLLGLRQYETRIAKGQKEASTNVSHWPPGMYVVVVYSDGKPVGRAKFVVAR